MSNLRLETWMRWAGVLVCLAAVGGCAKKDPSQAAAKEVLATVTAQAVQRAEQEKWMATGKYQPADPALQAKIRAAIDALQNLTSYRMGLYSADSTGMKLFDAEFKGSDCHFMFRRSMQDEPWEFFLIKDRFYGQKGAALVDNGPGSRPEGEKLYLPTLVELRIAISQALNGEALDLGPATFNQQPVHRYDLRTKIPSAEPEASALTAIVDIDEKHGLLVHATVGNGKGFASSAERYMMAQRELAIHDVDKVEAITLPKVEIIPPEEKDIDSDKPALY